MDEDPSASVMESLSPFEPSVPTEEPVPQAKLQQTGVFSDKTVPEFDEQDYKSHRNVYVAVHVPYSMPRKHRHRKKHHKHRPSEDVPRTEMPEPKTPIDPCDRVRFILGAEDTDGPPAAGATTHSIFTELEELTYDSHDQHKMQWKETARWIKFEEDVEEGGDKWSKPHVATLSLHSLFELRSCMLKGSVLLDLPATNLSQISDYLLDSLVASKQLGEENREKVRTALLQRHTHQSTKDHENKFLHNIRSLGDIGRIGSSSKTEEGNGNGNGHGHHGHFPFSTPTLGVFNALRRYSTQSSRSEVPGNGNGNSGTRLEEEDHADSEQNINQPSKPDAHFMKKIPPGSEASNVLVGEVDFLTSSIIAFVRLQEGQLLGDLTEVPIPTRFLFILLGPKGNHQRYHEIGRSIATLMSDEVFHDVAYKARNREDLLAGVDEFLDKVTILPPGEWDPQIRLEPPAQVPSQADRRLAQAANDDEDESPKTPPVTCSKYPFKGLVDDVKRRYPKYRSDLRDALSVQTVAAIIFIYFANITPAITFGGVLSNITNETFGAIEMLLAVGIGNFVFALFAGQPLVVLGGTGPTLIFEEIVFNFCQTYDIPYLNFRFWIGTWTALFMILLVAVNASAIMRLFTRFTEEIFSSLISFIFIYEAFVQVWDILVDHPYGEWLLYPVLSRECDCYQFNISAYEGSGELGLDDLDLTFATRLRTYWDDPGNCSRELNQRYIGDDCEPPVVYPDVFLMSVILFFGTFFLSFYLKKFRTSRYLTARMRRMISDFAVFIAVIVWVLVDIVARVDTPKLDVPNVFSGDFLSAANRSSLLINPFGNGLPGWTIPAAILPAILATILLFMDQQITALVVNRKDNKLKKGPGYHLDLMIVGVLIFVHSLLGIPWVVGATVRSITHVQSLFIFSPCTAPGERPKFLGVREQRVTLFVMAILLGISILLYKVLSLVPLPVLYGIFLFIGVTSLYGVQFVQRLSILLMPDKYKPDYKFLRHIPNRRIHAYTIYQVVFLLLLCIFKVVGQISIIFPIVVLFLVVGRWLAGFLFLKHDLEILDDPIPDKLYCKRFVHHMDQQKATEEGNGLIEREEAKSDEIRSSPVLKQRDSSINLTQEVDKSDLWRNMVRRLDVPMPSPRRKARYGASSQSHSDTNAASSGLHTGTSGPEFQIPTIHLPPQNELYRSTAV